MSFENRKFQKLFLNLRMPKSNFACSDYWPELGTVALACNPAFSGDKIGTIVI
jgi:hypothetical protein